MYLFLYYTLYLRTNEIPKCYSFLRLIREIARIFAYFLSEGKDGHIRVRTCKHIREGTNQVYQKTIVK